MQVFKRNDLTRFVQNGTSLHKITQYNDIKACFLVFCFFSTIIVTIRGKPVNTEPAAPHTHIKLDAAQQKTRNTLNHYIEAHRYDAKAYIQLRLYKSVIESCATWSAHPHSHTLKKQASRHKNSIPSLLSPRLKQRLIDCAATPAQTDRAAHAGRHLRTDTDTFSNLRQHGLTVVLQG